MDSATVIGPAAIAAPQQSSAASKDVSLEAMRGIAAVIVVLWHCLLGFWPEYRAGLSESAFYGLIYGTSAVSFFFVLSGFVLTRTFFLTGAWPILIRGAVKRWPRLAGPVLMTTLASFALMKLGLYRFVEVGTLTGSPWLQTFANAFSDGRTPEFSLGAAVAQGTVMTFLRGDSWFDMNLWTMRYELFGSMVVFGMAALVHPLRKKPLAIVYCLGVVLVLAHGISPYYAAFPAGAALAALLPRKAVEITPLATAAAIGTAVYLLGFSRGAAGAYELLDTVLPRRVPAVYVHVAAAMLVIAAVESSPSAKALLSGRVFAALGEWSFPLYLIHLLVLCSFGCLVFLSAAEPWARLLASIATVVVSFVAAYPLVLFNRSWVRSVNRAVLRIC